MNWIRKPKRLAIYLRDGCACAYCGRTIGDGAKLTLDHLIPYTAGGSNRIGNLVTACLRCNSRRGTRSVRAFVGGDNDTLAHIAAITAAPIDRAAAKELIAECGGFVAACRSEVSNAL